MSFTREQFKKLAKKHLIALQGYDVNETIEIFGVEKLYDEIVESGIGGVNGSLLAVRIEEALAKYWYDTEYDFIDKTDDKKAEESRKRFRKWIDDNLEAFSKQ